MRMAPIYCDGCGGTITEDSPEDKRFQPDEDGTVEMPLFRLLFGRAMSDARFDLELCEDCGSEFEGAINALCVSKAEERAAKQGHLALLPSGDDAA